MIPTNCDFTKKQFKNILLYFSKFTVFIQLIMY